MLFLGVEPDASDATVNQYSSKSTQSFKKKKNEKKNLCHEIKAP